MSEGMGLFPLTRQRWGGPCKNPRRDFRGITHNIDGHLPFRKVRFEHVENIYCADDQFLPTWKYLMVKERVMNDFTFNSCGTNI